MLGLGFVGLMGGCGCKDPVPTTACLPHTIGPKKGFGVFGLGEGWDTGVSVSHPP